MSVTAEQLHTSFVALVQQRTGSVAQRQALIYADLKRIAHRVSGRIKSGETLRTTALLHEAWLQLEGADASALESRKRFMGLAATIMHRIAVDHIRERVAQKRGGGVRALSFDEAWQQAEEGEPDRLILRLHDGLAELTTFSPQLAELVELLFFVGLTQKDVATLRGVSERTVRRDWRKARALLYRFLNQDQ